MPHVNEQCVPGGCSLRKIKFLCLRDTFLHLLAYVEGVFPATCFASFRAHVVFVISAGGALDSSQQHRSDPHTTCVTPLVSIFLLSPAGQSTSSLLPACASLPWCVPFNTAIAAGWPLQCCIFPRLRCAKRARDGCPARWHLRRRRWALPVRLADGSSPRRVLDSHSPD